MSDNNIKVGACIPAGLEAAKTFKSLQLGNFVLAELSLNKKEALDTSNFFRKNGIYFIFGEFLRRGTFNLRWKTKKKTARKEFYNKKDLEEIFRMGGEYFFGRITIGEAGGMLYWPKEYLIECAVREYKNLPRVKDVVAAKKVYREYIKKIIDFEKNTFGKCKFLNVDSSMTVKYQIEAGIDIPLLEVMPGNPNTMHAAIRGAAKAYNRKRWGAHIAMGWYGGVALDTLWFRRWKASLYFSFLAGADLIYSESGPEPEGPFGYNQKAIKHGFHSSEMRKYRTTLKEFYQFTRIHSRPKNGPRVKIGFVYGNLDGAPGLWNKYVWGQFKERKWLHGPAEWGWDYLDGVHQKEEWFNNNVQGEHDFSGNPPYGQYDIVPIESALVSLKRYGCLIFLGWNTMTAEIYQKLKNYVRSGGHLIMAIPHLSTHIDRAKEIKLYRNGDYRDLFGVIVGGKGKKGVIGVKYCNDSSLVSYKLSKWGINTDPKFIGEMTPAAVKITSARVLAGHDTDFYDSTIEKLTQKPILIENSIDKGKAFLVTTWSYPGDKGMNLFMKDLLRIVSAGEQGNIRVIGSDKIRYSVYEEILSGAKIAVVYLFNTDFDCKSLVNLWVNGKIFPSVEVFPNEMRIVYHHQGLAISPESKFINLECWKVRGARHKIEFFNLREQTLRVYNLSNQSKTVEINGGKIICKKDSGFCLVLKKRGDPLKKKFFVPQFLSEPKISGNFGKLPY